MKKMMLSLSHFLRHVHSLRNAHTLSLSQTYTLSLSLTHTLTHTLPLSLSSFFTFSLQIQKSLPEKLREFFFQPKSNFLERHGLTFSGVG